MISDGLGVAANIVRLLFRGLWTGLELLLTWAVTHPLPGLVVCSTLWVLAKVAGVVLHYIHPKTVRRL